MLVPGAGRPLREWLVSGWRVQAPPSRVSRQDFVEIAKEPTVVSLVTLSAQEPTHQRDYPGGYCRLTNRHFMFTAVI